MFLNERTPLKFNEINPTHTGYQKAKSLIMTLRTKATEMSTPCIDSKPVSDPSVTPIPPGMKEYFGMNEIQLVNAFKKAEAAADKKSLLKRHPGLPAEEANRLMKLPYQDQVKELDSLAALEAMPIKGKPHATGGRVSLSAGGLAGMLGE